MLRGARKPTLFAVLAGVVKSFVHALESNTSGDNLPFVSSADTDRILMYLFDRRHLYQPPARKTDAWFFYVCILAQKPWYWWVQCRWYPVMISELVLFAERGGSTPR
jgi:hypothetical protein